MPYHHLTADDRVVIGTLLGEQRSQSYIARRLGVDRSTISRELTRGKTTDKPIHLAPLPQRPAILDEDCRHTRGSGRAQDKYEALAVYTHAVRMVRHANCFYAPRPANKCVRARRTGANQSRARLVYRSGSWLEKHVRHYLISKQWSPEQICGDLRRNHGIILYPQTVYDYIALCPNKTDKKRLQRQLRHGGRPYRHHGTNARLKARRDRLPSIHTRPAVVENRTRLGDLEGDTIVGVDTRDRILTHVDRSCGICTLDRILGYTARKVTDHTVKRVQATHILTHTITYDRGVEFSDYERLRNKTNTQVYFADAYHSWERGSSENLNGLVRQYVPKRTDFKTISTRQVKTIEIKLNTRPRKHYNWRTPIQQRQYMQCRDKLGFLHRPHFLNVILSEAERSRCYWRKRDPSTSVGMTTQ